ncbi:MAG: type II toxin-antitoxin system HicA family toxin [Flavobacteriales bacterium]
MKSSELIRILKKNGWFVVRQSGSHMIMRHPDKAQQLTVPNHGSQEVGTGLANKILKDAGLK